MEQQYQIRTETYEGPFDLLLSLIEKRKLLINDIALAEVTDDYLKHLENKQSMPVAETAQFVLIGSTLLLIKSKSLLPVMSLSSEEEDSIEDLEMRLKVYDRYKTIARSLLSEFNASPVYGRNIRRQKNILFSPEEGMTVDTLHASMLEVLQNLPKFADTLPEKIVQKVMSLDDMMDTLSKRINESIEVSFRQFSNNVPGGKTNMIVSFLAMLELVRQGVVRVEQHERFSDIQMKADTVQLPRYN